MADTYVTKRKIAFAPILEKKKFIQEETVKIKQQKEVREVALEQAKGELAAVNTRIQEADEQLEGITKALHEVSDQSFALLSAHTRYLKDASDTVDGWFLLVKSLELKVAEQETLLKQIELEKSEALKRITNEEERLSVIRADLNIYRKRLQKKIEENSLQDQIKIIIPPMS